jgi:hypothetical protein
LLRNAYSGAFKLPSLSGKLNLHQEPLILGFVLKNVYHQVS